MAQSDNSLGQLVVDDILISLRPLFAKAEQHGLWFYSPYQSLWFSPAALHEAQAKGRFRWGAVNWELRDPLERVRELRHEGKEAFLKADALEVEI